MLVVVSPNTTQFIQVGFLWEVGFGYDKTHLSVLTLKGIKDESLT